MLFGLSDSNLVLLILLVLILLVAFLVILPVDFGDFGLAVLVALILVVACRFNDMSLVVLLLLLVDFSYAHMLLAGFVLVDILVVSTLISFWPSNFFALPVCFLVFLVLFVFINTSFLQSRS